ncbi:MAG: hypothetical protein HC876_21510, partial [Chloroflexaceae bacterium]|nr:hypothetical protein [Chloroflexaceae bacterium]
MMQQPTDQPTCGYRARLRDSGLLLLVLLAGVLLAQWAYLPGRAVASGMDTVPVLLPLDNLH